ncbi:MAG: DUF2383 domain-containing protein [Bdellovibrionales bacterium]|nr:DUF2383 domain-containing protein [Bdellovibrionales bacterium]
MATVIETGTTLAYLNHILRGERAAVDTYQTALESVEDEEICQSLRKMMVDHKQNVLLIEREIQSMGGAPEESAGVWGTVANGVTEVATNIGDKTTLLALRAGEGHGIREYEGIINSSEMLNSSEVLLNKKLLPDCIKHNAELTKLIDSM